MQIDAVGPGRRGSLDEGVGKLTLKANGPVDARQLKIVWDELRAGNLGYWTPLMWALQNEKLTKAEEQVLECVIDKVKEEFENEMLKQGQ